MFHGKYSKSLLAVSAFMLMITSSLHATPLVDPNADPFDYFNVYSLHDITYSSSDFEGKVGAAGDISFINFSLGLLDPGNYVLHAGGSVSLGSGAYYGSIEAGRDVSLANATVYGDLHSGGNISNTNGGNIYGIVYASGSINLDEHYVTNGAHSGIAYSPLADHGFISTYFLDYSNSIGLMPDTGSIENLNNGSLRITAVSGINVFSIDDVSFKNAYEVKINGPADAIVYLNVTGETPILNATSWYYYGVPKETVLLNYWQATSLTYTSSNYVNLLAPLAATSFSGGVNPGNLIVGDLSGSGQVNLGHFKASTEELPSPIPEPTTMLLFGTGLAGLTTRLRRKGYRQSN